ncbi:hypothetical protein SADUNF_Sadunf11G0020800 [Salix dunnii]|uniref:Retrotransposon Copia-like N-terminal domain-containing protein n=1 Tax=Salix dunnii TaxID=1413687 RepID=A0A835MQ20_9ROSI|nr:hypothetical protein SADUNF_Sadunf11G0020800 [Salix dunnii]
MSIELVKALRQPMAEKMTSAAPIVVQSETSNFNIGVVLDENNYDLWAPLVEMHIAGRRKTGYLRGSVKAPKEDDPKYDDWFSEDQRVKSWLLSAMKPELMKRHIRLPTAAAIWRTLKTAFVDEKNGVKIYTLNQKAFHLRQNGRPISIFFGELYEIFQELDHYNTIAMICEKDPRASIAKTKNSYKSEKELNLVAEQAADDHSIALITASGHEGESRSHTEIHNLAYKEIALPDEVHHDKDNDKLALESPPGTGEEPMPRELIEAPDNIQSETIHDHIGGKYRSSLVQQCAIFNSVEPINSSSESP